MSPAAPWRWPRPRKLGLEGLSLAELQAIHPGITDGMFSVSVGAEFGEEPHLVRRHRAGRGAQADPRYWRKRLAKAYAFARSGAYAPANFARSGCVSE